MLAIASKPNPKAQNATNLINPQSTVPIPFLAITRYPVNSSNGATKNLPLPLIPTFSRKGRREKI